MLDKIEKWETQKLSIVYLKKYAKGIISESMILDKFSSDSALDPMDPWWFTRNYFINMPEPYTEKHALQDINRDKERIKSRIRDSKKKLKYWKKIIALKMEFDIEFKKSIKNFKD